MKPAGVTLFFLLLFFSNSFSQHFNQTIRGVITDEDSKLPIAGAVIAIAGSHPLNAMEKGTDGNFRLENVIAGSVTLQVSYTGYENIILPNIVVNSGKEVVLIINMQQAVVQMKDVVITVNKNKAKALNDMAIVGGPSISPEQTNRYEGGFNDPSRYSQILQV